jgi:hypothetical protein
VTVPGDVATARVSDGDGLGTAALSLLDDLVAETARLDLPAAPDPLLRMRSRLRDDAYRVLVVGEAKNGKTSFVNALLGSAVLPTAVDVATSQVFAVRDAEQESFRLRLDDGAAVEIGRDDLATYGSQVAADGAGGVTARHDLRWIEVDVPAPFLPARVTLLDTPGLGALYAAHAQVTRRFLPLADAVLVVLDSARPMGQRELDLVGEVLALTGRVFFVQTKIDQHERQGWERTLQRNEQILAERFGAALGTPHVWPLSSRNLAAATGSQAADALLLVSRYPTLARQLSAFLSTACGTPRAVEALVLAVEHHQSALRMLEGRLRELIAPPRSGDGGHRAAVEALQQDYQRDWGDRGRRRLELETEIRRATALAKQAFREELSSTGPLVREHESRIGAVTSVAEANQLGEELAGSVVAGAADAWARTCALVQQRYAEILAPFLEATAEAATVPADPLTATARFDQIDDPLYDRLRTSYGHASPVYMVSGIVLSMVGGPLVLVAAAGGVLWSLAKGWRQGEVVRARAGRGELQRHLRAVLADVQSHFFAVHLADGRFSRVDESLNRLEGEVLDQVAQIAGRRAADLRQELALLEVQAQLGEQERVAAARAAAAALDTWRALGDRLADLLRDDRAADHLATLLAAGHAG